MKTKTIKTHVFFVKDIKNEIFKSITSLIKEIVDIKGKDLFFEKL